ncbi:Transcriptional regulator SNIP1, contains FHA domain [Plasmopara halstedii]|uniref:Transcriptional regulator SNIP1, contains FHA domain n=1 Tax=Plasmopara halstedii TaxID=4781 RepID=A0A0P1AQM3_PLAHL|nr:Transcriptional regulator SNIP1, contains FHA domain [Plasmopara halstedii]CEG43793.1 Transcriptional regulator SNIP1, contains FHA domain [Plasmopara halstedii]|eukprot:XP_024580162.1 Transcriptional regulator SNIP1, contains FHA domain [Plasmopara halstedii]
MDRHHRRQRFHSRSPPRRSIRARHNQKETRSRSPIRSRSSSLLRRQRNENSPPSHDQRKCDKKTRDFSHLVQWGKVDDEVKEEEPIQIEKPNFGLTGALAKDQTTGNMQNGVILKFSEPPEARQPTKRYRLYVFKNDKNIATLHVHRKSVFLIGRDKAVADILTEHPSCSKQHAVLQYRMYQKETATIEQEVRPYIMDLNSTNSTFLNGVQIESSRYIELKEKDVLKFGESTREYVLICAV